MADKTVLDLNGLTFGEMEIIEDKCGKPVSEVFAGGQDGNAQASATALRTLAYIALRRDDPGLTWEDTADLVLADFEFGHDEVPPTDERD